MASKYDAPPLTIPMTKELDRRIHQAAHDSGIPRSELARRGIEIICNELEVKPEPASCEDLQSRN